MRVRRCWLLWMLTLGLLGLPGAGHAVPAPGSSPLPVEPAGRTASAPAADSLVRLAGDSSSPVSSYRLATGPSAIRSLAASDPEPEFGPERDPRFERDGFSDQPKPKGKKQPRPTADIVAVLLAGIIAALLVCRKSP